MDSLFALGQYSYFFLFLALILAGESVLLPALYLVFDGKLALWPVVFAQVLASLISDAFWYTVGYLLTHRRVARILGHRRERVLEQLNQFFAAKKYFILFFSKFIYGTRIVVQVLCGVYRVNSIRYVFVNTLGIITHTALLTFLTYLSHRAVLSIEGFSTRFVVVMAILIPLILFTHIGFKKYIYPRWFQ